MATFGLSALENAGVGPNAGIGNTLPFFQNVYDQNFLPLEQELSGIFSDPNFVSNSANRSRTMGLAAGNTGNDVTQRSLSGLGIGLDPRQQAFMDAEANRNPALAGQTAGNLAFRGMDKAFSTGQQAFAGLGANLSDLLIGNDVSLQGFDIQRGVGQRQAAMKAAIQRYLSDTALAQTQNDAQYAIGEGRDARNGKILGDVFSSAWNHITKTRPDEAP